MSQRSPPGLTIRYAHRVSGRACAAELSQAKRFGV